MTRIIVAADLELRPLTAECAPSLFALTDANRSYLREWLPWLDNVRVVTDTAAFIGQTIELQRENGALTAGIWWQEELAGVIGHNRIDWANRIAFPGYWLAADRQGHGIMTRCCRALVQHAFAQLDLNRVEICAAVKNHRSQAVPKRLGFTREGVRRQGEWLYDRFVDLDVYSLLKSDWQLKSALSEGK